ncbi:hypothetical protein [Coleofasciculus sp. FACHB-1120]|uniref:GspE/PulE/PilB domain-containing protein n=1 Tax=Coleofasciculus sp. FACHB-1120 TaxID=2692783 RepID=UPI001684DE2E|nr:hypothetical protein [Coleofasciculus sp. FACHB-1120]MBD2742803.1 hypothetical protein [Coleofasciculus sp. FACHB-1120]
MFRLIDKLLPFEACLYYQILPIALEGTCLKLGMVNPADTASLDYVRRILAYQNYSLETQPIAADALQAILSAYLKHNTGTEKQPAHTQPPTPATEHSDTQPDRESSSKNSDRIERQTVPTLIVDSPEALGELEAERTNAQMQQKRASEALLRQSQPVKRNTTVPPAGNSSHHWQERSQHHISGFTANLAALPPQQMLKELLKRVLNGTIDRLDCERHLYEGNILCSRNNVLQFVIPGLALPVLQGVIDELKRIGHLQLIPVEQTKVVEIERCYQHNHLLLRLQIMPGEYGDEAIMQVFRGETLKAYQQQHLENLWGEALNIAHKLQRKMNQICHASASDSVLRTSSYPTSNPAQLEALPALHHLIENVEQQLEGLKRMQSDRPNPDANSKNNMAHL